MEDSALERVLAAIDKDSPVGARDYAIAVLMMAYGIRGISAAELLLDDIDWQHSRIRIRAQKGGKEVMLPLLEPVGDAMLGYLRHRFAQTPFREVFLSTKAPFQPLSGLAISMIVRRYMKAGRRQIARRWLENPASFLGHSSVGARLAHKVHRRRAWPPLHRHDFYLCQGRSESPSRSGDALAQERMSIWPLAFSAALWRSDSRPFWRRVVPQAENDAAAKKCSIYLDRFLMSGAQAWRDPLTRGDRRALVQEHRASEHRHADQSDLDPAPVLPAI